MKGLLLLSLLLAACTLGIQALTSVALATAEYRSSFITKGNTLRTTRPSSAGKYPENNKTIKCRINKDAHLYTLIICPNETYEVKIDNKQVVAGDLEEDWNFLPPRKIKDLCAWKPRKWGELQIEDPEDTRSEGQWKPRIIDNPNYQGEWIHPEMTTLNISLTLPFVAIITSVFLAWTLGRS